MSRRHLLMLGALAAIWGSSFMFITIALRDLAPSTLILFRMGFGALALAVFVQVGRPPLRAAAAVRPAAGAAGADQHGCAVLPDRLGPAVHRLRAGCDLQRLRAALHGALRPLDRPDPARHRLAARRSRARVRRRHPPRRLRARGRRARRRRSARRRRRGCLLRHRRALCRQALRRPAVRPRRVRVARLGDDLRPPARCRAGERASAGRRCSPCSISASRRPASPTSSTSA